MRDLRKWQRTGAALAAVALLASACGDGETTDGASTPPPDASDTGDDGPTDDPGDDMMVTTDVGVTEEPCPSDHPETVNADNGCIYLGTLSDLTEGPFAALGVEIVAGQVAFWRTVNEAGGIGGYDVDVTEYTRDNKYNPEEHVAQFRAMEPNVLALAQTLGTPPTLAALSLMQDSDVVGAPASWWSGWAFEDVILESGYNYCIEAMDGLDYAHTEWVEGGVASVLSVSYPGDYGGDSAAGVAAWAAANGVAFDAATGVVQTGPNASVGNQDGPVAKILEVNPSVVLLATGPLEAAEIIGKSAAQGYQGRFLGSVPTWNPALLGNPDLAAVLPLVYRHIGPWGSFGSDSDAHRAMAASLGGELPGNDGFTFGWIWSYPLKSVLLQAVSNGDLTRAGVRAAAGEVSVDYEGALPDQSYSGDPASTVARAAIISVPDPDAPLGISTVKDFFTGPTAAAYDFTEPCISLG